jgi:hypothetical protein
MSRGWLEIQDAGASARLELRAGLTRIGGPGADFVLRSAPRGELHVWDDPPRIVYLGAGDPPRFGGAGGAPVEERDLVSGDAFEWAGARIRFEGTAASAKPVVLEEIPIALPGKPARPAAAGGAALAARPVAEPLDLTARDEPTRAGTLRSESPESLAWARVRAGLLVELGLSDDARTRRWQEAVMRGEFEPDACARELNATATVGSDDPRLSDRTVRLLRDLLMAPLQRGLRGAGRRARSAARGGAAFLVAQLLVVLVYTGILVVTMVVVRLKWNYSFDGLFDRVLGR